jgi:hypothetical protein
MSEDTIRMIIGNIPSTLSAIASIMAVIRLGTVHKLVNSALTGALTRESAARHEVAVLQPSLENIAKAAASKQGLDDHSQSK